MDRDDLAADRKTEAKTVFLRGVKRIEQSLSVRRMHADPSIRDCYHNLAVCGPGRGGQNAAPSLDASHGFDCIAHQVENNLLELDPIRRDVRQCPVEIDLEGNASSL